MKRVAAPMLVVAVLIAGAGPLRAAEEKKAETQNKKQDKKQDKTKKAEPHVSPIYQAAEKAGQGKDIDESVVITNAELEKMWAGLSPSEKLEGVYQAERHIGAPSGAEAAAGATPSGDAAPADKNAQPAPKNVTELRTKVDELERRLLALRNPLLPRRYAERKDEKNENWDKMNNAERIAATEKELEKAKEDLAAAERGASAAPAAPAAPAPQSK